MLCRRVSGSGLGGVGTCGGRGVGGGRDVAWGLAEDGRKRRVCRAEGGEELREERRPVGALQQRGGAVRGGGVPHAQHAEPQLKRRAKRGCGELGGQEDSRGGCAEFEGGDKSGGVAGRGCQHRWVREQAPRQEQLQGEVGGAVVLQLGGGVREGAVTEGAGHTPVAGGVALGVQKPQVHDAVEG